MPGNVHSEQTTIIKSKSSDKNEAGFISEGRYPQETFYFNSFQWLFMDEHKFLSSHRFKVV